MLVKAITFKFHYPARGRKHWCLQDHGNFEPLVQIPLPRKGTETFSYPVAAVFSAAFKFHYPARGRKPRWYFVLLPQTPRSNSITPQGDGNLSFFMFVALVICWLNFYYPSCGRNPVIYLWQVPQPLVQIPLPRKGTETRMHLRPRQLHHH